MSHIVIEDEYIKCVKQLGECLAHLKEFNQKLKDIGCKSYIPSDDIEMVEHTLEDMQQHIEESIGDCNDSK